VIRARVLMPLAGLGLAAWAAIPPLAQLDPPAREARLASDAAAVLVYRAGLRDVVAYVDARADLFARDPAGTPSIPRARRVRRSRGSTPSPRPRANRPS
jgi:hypothetical protein